MKTVHVIVMVIGVWLLRFNALAAVETKPKPTLEIQKICVKSHRGDMEYGRTGITVEWITREDWVDNVKVKIYALLEKPGDKSSTSAAVYGSYVYSSVKKSNEHWTTVLVHRLDLDRYGDVKKVHAELWQGDELVSGTDKPTPKPLPSTWAPSTMKESIEAERERLMKEREWWKQYDPKQFLGFRQYTEINKNFCTGKWYWLSEKR